MLQDSVWFYQMATLLCSVFIPGDKIDITFMNLSHKMWLCLEKIKRCLAEFWHISYLLDQGNYAGILLFPASESKKLKAGVY